MIDFLKILITNNDLIELLYSNKLLKGYSVYGKYVTNINKENPEVTQSQIVKVYKEVFFCFYSRENHFTKLEILIKPHYLFNNNLHNANDFKATDCISILKKFKNTFKLSESELKILNIEIGINGLSPIKVEDLITYTIYHEKNEFINSSDNLKYCKVSQKFNQNGKGNNYKKIKFYAKGIQYPEYSNRNTFRFEINSKRTNFIKSLGVYTFKDLLELKTYNSFAKKIAQEFSKVLILDINNTGENLSPKEQFKLATYQNPVKWYKCLEGSKNTFRNNKTQYFKLLNKTGNNIHRTITKIINDKLSYLQKDCANLTPPLEEKNCADLTVYIMENGTKTNNKKCVVTGLDLTHEKKDAIYIRTKTLRYLRQNEKKVYYELCSFLLSGTRGNRPKFERSIISHLAKQVRDRYYNPKTVKKTGYRQRQYKNQLELFCQLN